MYAYLTKEIYNRNYFIVKILTKAFPFLLNWVWKFICQSHIWPGNQYQLPISWNFEKSVDLLLY